MAKPSSSASLVAENTFNTAIVLRKKFNLSISGTWAGTITLQRSFDGGVTWLDISSYTANTQQIGEEAEYPVHYRVGFKTGDYSSGTAVVRLGG